MERKVRWMPKGTNWSDEWKEFEDYKEEMCGKRNGTWACSSLPDGIGKNARTWVG